MASLLNSGFSSGLNGGNYLNQGGYEFFVPIEIDCVVTTSGVLAQSSILDPTGFKRDLKRVTAIRQIIIEGL